MIDERIDQGLVKSSEWSKDVKFGDFNNYHWGYIWDIFKHLVKYFLKYTPFSGLVLPIIALELYWDTKLLLY